MTTLNSIKLENIAYFYDNYYIGDESLDTLIEITEGVSTEKALDTFIDEYIMSPIDKYQDLVFKYLGFSLAGSMNDKEKSRVASDIASLTFGLSALLIYNYRRYNKKVEMPVAFKDAKLTAPVAKRYIYDENITKYEETISNALTRTQASIINAIKSVQKDYSIFDSIVDKQNLEGVELANAISSFKEMLYDKYKNIFDMQNTKKMVPILSKDGKVRNYKIDYYIDMVTRNTIIGMSRDSNEAAARINGERVVEFLQVDHRHVKHDRKICQRILGIKVMGVSILALDPVAATVLGVMTVDEAKTTPDFFAGPSCRHGLKRLSNNYLKKIDKLIEEAS